MVVAVQATGGLSVRGTGLKMAYFDHNGTLPDDDQQTRLKGYLQAMFREMTGLTTDIDLELRPWQPSDGSELVDWRTALRRWAAKGGPRP
jgi:hypothetical protein